MDTFSILRCWRTNMENIDLLGISSSLRDLIEDDDKYIPKSDSVTKFITTEDIFKAYRDDNCSAMNMHPLQQLNITMI